MAHIPAITPGRFNRPNIFCCAEVDSPGKEGSAFNTQIVQTTPITAITSAIDTAPKMTDSALGTTRIGTSRMVSDADIAQKPPSASPRQARPTRSKEKLLAKETSRQETVSRTENRITT